jgi:hypothetical protein
MRRLCEAMPGSFCSQTTQSDESAKQAALSCCSNANSTLRWMPVDAYPDGAGLSCQLVIESKGFHGRSTRGGQSHHSKAVLAPLEMLSPYLAPWVKQTAAQPCLRIDPLYPMELGAIAHRTGQTQVIFGCEPPFCQRYNVIDVKSLPG